MTTQRDVLKHALRRLPQTKNNYEKSYFHNADAHGSHDCNSQRH